MTPTHELYHAQSVCLTTVFISCPYLFLSAKAIALVFIFQCKFESRFNDRRQTERKLAQVGTKNLFCLFRCSMFLSDENDFISWNNDAKSNTYIKSNGNFVDLTSFRRCFISDTYLCLSCCRVSLRSFSCNSSSTIISCCSVNCSFTLLYSCISSDKPYQTQKWIKVWK